MASRNDKNTCFYSNGCKWSKQFIESLGKTPYFNDFNFICVDPGKYNGRLPDFLKQTPTLVIKGESEPRINENVMNWLFHRQSNDLNNNKNGHMQHTNVNQLRPQLQQQKPQIQQQIHMQQAVPPRGPMPGIVEGMTSAAAGAGAAPIDGPSAFNMFEMGKLRQDNYSFIDDNLQDVQMVHSYEFIGGGNIGSSINNSNMVSGMQGGQGGQSNQQKSDKEKSFDNDMER
jgi:hypothetical protein